MNRASRIRRSARMLLSAATCLAAASCAGAAGTAAAPGARPQPWPTPTGAGTVTITVLSGTDTSSSGNEQVNKDEPGMYAELTDWWNRYETPSTHIRIALAEVTGGATAVHSEMLADAESGDTGNDIYNLDNEWVPEFAAAKFIGSLAGRLPADDDFLPLPLASGEYDGSLYAAPFTTDVGLLYYRKDLVSAGQVNALGSFSALIKLANKTESQETATSIGYAGQLDDYEGLTVNLLEIIHSDRRDAFAANGTIRHAGAVTTGLRQLSADMYTTGVISRDELSYTESQAFNAFATGRALFMRNWPIYYGPLKSASAPGRSAHPGQIGVGQIGVAPLPFPSVLGGQDLAISTDSKNPGAALRVIEYLTSRQAERCLFAVGGFPATRNSAYPVGPELPTGYGHVTGHPLCGTQPGVSPQIGPRILAGIRHAFLRPRTPYYTGFSANVQHAVTLILSQPDSNPLEDNSLEETVSGLQTDLVASAAGHLPPTASSATGTPLNIPRFRPPASAILNERRWGQLPRNAARSDPGMVRARGRAPWTRSPLSSRKKGRRGRDSRRAAAE